MKYQKLILFLLSVLAIKGCYTPFLVQPAGESLTKLNASDSYSYKSTSISVIGSKQPYLGQAPSTTMRDLPVYFWPLDFINLRMQHLLAPISKSKDNQFNCEAILHVTSVDYHFFPEGPKGSFYVIVGFNAQLNILSLNDKFSLQRQLSSGRLNGKLIPMKLLGLKPQSNKYKMEYINVSTRAAKILVDKVLQTIDSVEQCQ